MKCEIVAPKYEDMYTELGLFEVKEQTAQVRFFFSLSLWLIAFAAFSDLGSASRTLLAVCLHGICGG